MFSNVYGGFTFSPDEVVEIRAAEHSLRVAFAVVGVVPVEGEAPLALGLEPVGLVYEVQPPGLEFAIPARMRFTLEGEGKGPVERMGIYWYDWLSEQWVRCETRAGKGELWTEVSRIARLRALYGVFVDMTGPEVPVVDAVEGETPRRAIALTGTSEAYGGVRIERAGRVVAEAAADRRGSFRAEGVPPEVGENELAVYAIDAAGNASLEPARVRVKRVERPPRAVKKLEVLGPDEAIAGGRYLVRLEGEDSSAETVDTTYVLLTSTGGAEEGQVLELVETEADSGVYVGEFAVTSRGRDGAAGEASEGLATVSVGVDGEEVMAISLVDVGQLVRLRYRDWTGPSVPNVRITPRFQAVCWTFEEPEEQILAAWRGVGGRLGAAVSVEEDERGNRYLKLVQQENVSHVGVAVPLEGPVDLEQYPLVSFDYRIPEGVGVDLMVRAPNSSWRWVKLCGQSAHLPYEGTVPGIVADGQWRHVEIDLGAMLGPERFAGSPYALSEMELAAYRMDLVNTLRPGRTTGKGAYYCIDNFRVHDSPSDGAMGVEWQSEDAAGVAGYSVLIDQQPATVPPAEVSKENRVSWTLAKEGRWFLHVRAVDALGNWGATVHVPLSGEMRTASVFDRGVAMLRRLEGIETVRDRWETGRAMDYAEKLRALRHFALSGMLEEQLWMKSTMEPTARIQAMRRALGDYAAAGHLGRARSVLYRWAGVQMQEAPTVEQLDRILTFVRQLAERAAAWTILTELEHAFEGDEVLTGVVKVRGLARWHLERGEHERVERLCEEVSGMLAGDAVAAEALEVLGHSLFKRGERERLREVCEVLHKEHPGSAGHGAVTMLLARVDRDAARFADAAQALRELIGAGPSLEGLRVAVPELLRMVWEVHGQAGGIEIEVASLLDVPENLRRMRASALRFAILALKADGNQAAAEAAMQAVLRYAPDTPEAEWVGRQWVLP